MQTLCIPALSDNYIHLLSDAGSAVAVDPGDAGPVLARLQGIGLRLRTVLLTHRHADHTAGADELRRATGCTIAGPDECAACGLDQVLADGGTTACGSHLLRVLAIPGHTAGHLAYHCERTGDVWTGDTLFVGGCGRVLEGTAARMWQSLCRLRDLPPGTRVHCGHNYTLDNFEFAASLLPGDPDIAARLSEVREWAQRGQVEISSTIGIERRTNLFLRADQSSVRAALGMQGADPVAVFAELRRRKDAW